MSGNGGGQAREHSVLLLAILPLVGTMIVWGFTYPLSRIAVGYMGAQPAAALRFGLATLALLGALAIADRGRPRIPAGLGPRIALGGMLGIAGYNLLFYVGLTFAPSIDAAALMPVASPVTTVLLAFLLGGERLSRLRAAGLLLGVAGCVLFLAASRVDSAYPQRLLGDLMFIGASACWGTFTLMGRRLMASAGPMRVMTWSMAAGTFILVLAALPAASAVDWQALPVEPWAITLFLGLVSTAIGYALYYRGVRDAGPTSAAIALLLLPLTGTTGAVLLLGEALVPLQVAGAVTLAVAAYLALARAPARAASLPTQGPR
ncbi:MAG: DMT family transporter [Chloroflexota bacterium]